MQTFTALQYLKIDAASNYGLDKETWNDRIKWFDDNEADIMEMLSAIESNPKAKHPLLTQADAPAMFYASTLAYRRAMSGQPVAHAISLDATASGAQILAVLIGCEKSARLCNVIDTGNREDLYTNIFHGMLSRLPDAGNISRSDAKDAVMTALYGSKAQPKRVFGEGEQLATFYQTMSEDAPGIWELNQALLGLWQSDVLSHDWVMPDNFHVQTKVIDKVEEQVQFFNSPVTVVTTVNQPMESGLALAANGTHSFDGLGVREVTRRCNYDAAKVQRLTEILATGAHWVGDKTREQDTLLSELLGHYERTGFLSARVLEITDEQNVSWFKGDALDALKELVSSLPLKPFDVLSVHDCFRVHPNYGNDLRRQYNRVLYDLARSDVLADFARQITGNYRPVNKIDDFTSDILVANYALS
jgi:hypothetical protein